MLRNRILMAPEGDAGSGTGEKAAEGQPPANQQPPQQPPGFDMNAFLGQLRQTVHETVNSAVEARLSQRQPNQEHEDNELAVDDDTKKFVAGVMQQAMAPLSQAQRAIADNLDSDKFVRLCNEIGATAEEVAEIEKKYRAYVDNNIGFTNGKRNAAMSRLDAADMVIGSYNIDKRRKEGADRARQRGNAHAMVDTGGRDSGPGLPANLDTLPLVEQNKKLADILDKDGF